MPGPLEQHLASHSGARNVRAPRRIAKRRTKRATFLRGKPGGLSTLAKKVSTATVAIASKYEGLTMDDDPDRVRHRRGPGRGGSRPRSQPAWRQRHRTEQFHESPRRQTAGASGRDRAECKRARAARQPEQSQCRARHQEPAGGGAGARAAARGLKVASERDLETAFAAIADQRLGALFVNIDSFFGAWADQPVALAARHRVPAIYPSRRRMGRSTQAESSRTRDPSAASAPPPGTALGSS